MRNTLPPHLLKQSFYYDVTSPSCLRWKVDHYNIKANTPVYPRGLSQSIIIFGERVSFAFIVWVLHDMPELGKGEGLFFRDDDKSNLRIENLQKAKLYQTPL